MDSQADLFRKFPQHIAGLFPRAREKFEITVEGRTPFQLSPKMGEDPGDGLVATAASTARKMAASCLSAWSSELIHQLIDRSDRFAAGLTKIYNYILRGRVSATDLWLRGRLVLLLKKGHRDSNSNLRPVSIDEPLFRVLCRAVAKSVEPYARKNFAPVQLGVAMSDSAGTVVHAVQAGCNWVKIARVGVDEPRGVLTMDMENAHNSYEHTSV